MKARGGVPAHCSPAVEDGESDDPRRGAMSAAPELARQFQAASNHLDEAVELLQRLVAIPSVSSAGRGLVECAEAVAEMARASGLDVELLPTEGAPVVYGELPGPPGAPTLLLYGHYDVQPAEPLDAWVSPPFRPTLRDGAVYGRGAGDNKGQFVAHLVAARILHRRGAAPLTLKLLIEGEEEIGSPHLGPCVEAHRERLSCDLALTADGPFHDDGRPLIVFGVRGLLYLELRARGANRDVHSGNRGGLVPMPAWTLVEAVAALRGAGGPRIPGFLDAVRPPTEAERRLLDELPFDRRAFLDDLGLDQLPDDDSRNPWETLMFHPTLNLAGLSSGWEGPGTKTLVPCEAVAKLELRLVPDQEPDVVEAAVRRRLSPWPVSIERLAAVPPSSTPIDNPFTAPVAAALEAASGRQPLLRPRLGGTTPDWVFTRLLEVPSLLVPYGPADMDHHAPNEKIDLASLERGVRSTLAICWHLAKDAGSRRE